MEESPTPSIADLNDAFRKTCEPFLTPGILFLPALDSLLQAVREYEDFTSENDPYGEHDFGALGWCDERVLWKIDYYDQTLTYGEDPLSPECQRVLTIMTGDEY
jgi:uncharacterized protein DUF3768